jgi:hypothetical protein
LQASYDSVEKCLSLYLLDFQQWFLALGDGTQPYFTKNYNASKMAKRILQSLIIDNRVKISE